MHIGVASGMAGRAFALPIMPPERDVAARATIELFAEYSLAHVIYVCAPPIIFSLLRPCVHKARTKSLHFRYYARVVTG